MFREVTIIEVREVLRLRGEGLPNKRIAAQLGLDPKTVRRISHGSDRPLESVSRRPISDEEVRQVLLALHPDRWSAAGRRLVEQARAGNRGYRALLLGADVDQPSNRAPTADESEGRRVP